MAYCITGNFLRMADDDPRRRFAETLIEALDAFDGPIIVYSAYEQTRLRELAGEFPDLRASLNAIIARLVDLLPIVRGAVYFPEFGFSNSIKSVAPALCPGFGYDDLEDIADGAAASAAFLQLASGCLSLPRKPIGCGPRFSPIASAIRWPWSRCIGRCRGWLYKRMTENQETGGQSNNDAVKSPVRLGVSGASVMWTGEWQCGSDARANFASVACMGVAKSTPQDVDTGPSPGMMRRASVPIQVNRLYPRGS